MPFLKKCTANIAFGTIFEEVNKKKRTFANTLLLKKKSRKQGTTYRDNEGENARGTRYQVVVKMLEVKKV